MTTLASFVTEFGFKTDGSFEKAIQGMQKRLGALGTSVNGIGEGMSKSMQAAAKRLQVAQMNMQTQALKSEAAKMAMADKSHAAEIKRISTLQSSEARLSATKAMNAERERLSERKHIQDMARFSERAALDREKLALRTRNQEFREEQARMRRAGGGGSGGIGLGSNPLSGIPVMGRTTLGMMASGFGISELARQSYQAALFQAKTMPTLKFITGSEENAKVEKAFIDANIKRLSLDKVGATKDYTDFAASAYGTLGSKGTQDLFEGAQQIGIMTGRTSAEMHLAFKALGQINTVV